MTDAQQPEQPISILEAGLDLSGLMYLGLERELHSPAEPGSGRSHFVPPKPEDLEEHFPDLEILECIGRGGMGCVYKARQRHLDRFVALKILPAELGHDSAFTERFTREARAQAKFNHPNIVTLHDFGFSGGLYYLVMEYMDGMNLRELLQVERPTPEKTLSIIAGLSDALQYAHEQSIVHRDVKPENILFDRRGHVKIADFGLVKLAASSPLETSLTRTRDAMGTPHYMAPEQWDDPQTVDHRADIYSLGVILYEMLTGRIPMGRFDLPSEKSNVDGRIDRICIRAMQRDPEKRYQQAGQLEVDIRGSSNPASMTVPTSLREWLEKVRAPRNLPAELLGNLMNCLIGFLRLIGSFFRAIGNFFKRQWELFPLMTIIGCGLILFACFMNWSVATRHTTSRGNTVDVRHYDISAFDSATIVDGVRLENYWIVVATAAIALMALLKQRHRVRSELLIALLSVYGVVHVILVYGFPSQKVTGRLHHIRESDFMTINLTVNPFFVGIVFGLLFLGALWNIAVMVYQARDENDRGMRSICRSVYRVMMGDPTTYI